MPQGKDRLTLARAPAPVAYTYGPHRDQLDTLWRELCRTRRVLRGIVEVIERDAGDHAANYQDLERLKDEAKEILT